ncbi:YueI family protein [Salisediminibacterium selenitireducens]|uniref:DUF1694 domain-containing protein n=1 Tax=Bacillus selenitireducens (strain ATCC 700615 / DSM 15326 / MLS10) TaxID=439292 RepID=D6XW58_BACIE|nr:YueI family protein [Salisediminibacterium selenitireducens]ADH99812.1 protein of unknown function DUF1694 [[Bacillus] selenitireducens MLS10]
MKDRMEQILAEGIYGKSELKPEEKALFLSNFAERVIISLTKSQVRKRGTYQELEQFMSKYPSSRLYINGTMNYSFYGDYIQLANKKRIPFTIVNDSKTSPLGIVLASGQATPDDPVFVQDELYQDDLKNR